MAKAQTKPKFSPWGEDHPEKLSDSPSTVGLSQQVKGLFNPENMLSQLFGEKKNSEKVPPVEKVQSFRKSNEIFIFTKPHQENQANLHKETEMILTKLKEQITILEKQEHGLVNDIAKVKVETLPPKAGIYYIRFLEYLLTVVRQLRMKVEHGRAWLETFNQKKKKKMGYWQKYKKHGTQFGLSQERTLATQTG